MLVYLSVWWVACDVQFPGQLSARKLGCKLELARKGVRERVTSVQLFATIIYYQYLVHEVVASVCAHNGKRCGGTTGL